MSEFEFFKGRADRWGDSMRAFLGSLEICHPTDHIDLPHHTAGELLSIGHLKVWGDAQKLHLSMAYFLVRADDSSEAGNYGLAIVWIDSRQARLVLMGEALEALSSHTPKGSDWPYILVQSYKDANHTPLPKDGHICVLPQGETRNPSGQISQIQIHQLLSAGPSVVFPMELNQGDQSVTIDLPESLHMGSSVINDEHPYIEVNIPTLVPKEQGNANLPLGEKCNTTTADQPKTSWKPRITLTAEVKDLIGWGMTDNYDQESEHSAKVEVPSPEAVTSSPSKREKPVLLLDTHSRTSAAETEASGESNPAGALPMAAVHSSHSSSPITCLSNLQSDVHLAINSMFTAKRSSDLKIQRAVQDFETSLHQREVEVTTANEKAKVAHSRRDLRAKVKCAKAMMKAKYEYHMTNQEARAERCTELEESEAIYTEALNRNAAALSLQYTTLHQEHTEHMWKLEGCALMTENKSCHDFLIAHQAVLHQAPQHSRMTSILPTPFYWDYICLPQPLRLEGDHSLFFPLSRNPNSPFPQRGNIHLQRHKATCQ